MSDAAADRDVRMAELLEKALAEVRTRGSVDAEQWRRRFPNEAEEVLHLLQMTQALETAASVCRNAGDTACENRPGLSVEQDTMAPCPSPVARGVGR